MTFSPVTFVNRIGPPTFPGVSAILKVQSYNLLTLKILFLKKHAESAWCSTLYSDGNIFPFSA